MKNFLKSKTFIISAAAALIIGGGVYAFVHFADHPHHVVSRIMHKLDHELNLSDAQHRRIEATLNDAVQRFRERRGSRLDSAVALLNQPQLTVQEVRSAMESHHAGGRRADMEAVIADALVQVHATLLPDQRTELAGWMQERMDDDWLHGRHGHHGRHHGFGHRWLH